MIIRIIPVILNESEDNRVKVQKTPSKSLKKMEIIRIIIQRKKRNSLNRAKISVPSRVL